MNTDRIDRRTFLQRSGALVGLAAAGGLAASSGSAVTAHAAPHAETAASGSIQLFVRSQWEAQFTQLIQEFEAANPKIKVTLSTAPFATYANKLLTDFSSGSAPDLTEMVDTNFYQFATKRLFLDLTKYIKSDPAMSLTKPGYGQFYPAITKFFQSGKSIYAIPGSVNPFGIGYNADLFQKAGVPTPYEQWKKGQWDWNAFVKTATAMTKTIDGKKVYGYCDLANLWNIAMRVWQNGGEILNANKTKILVDQPAAYNAIQWYFDLYLKHKVSPVSLMAPDAPGAPRFAAGEIAMFDGSPGARATLANAGFSWGVAPQPKQKKYASWAGGFGYAITKASKNPAAAWEFIKFASNESSSELLLKSGALTGSAQVKANNSPSFLTPPPQNVNTFLGMLETAQPQPFLADNVKWLQVWTNEMQLASIGRQSAKAAATAVKQQAQSLLASKR